jgi:hypothetical protein
MPARSRRRRFLGSGSKSLGHFRRTGGAGRAEDRDVEELLTVRGVEVD